MDRLTNPDGTGLIAPGSEEEAFEKLRRLENMTDALRAEQAELTAELARLKADNQTKAYHGEKICQRHRAGCPGLVQFGVSRKEFVQDRKGVEGF